MAKIHSIATGVPANRLEREQVRRVLRRHLSRLGLRWEPYDRILDRTSVDVRHTVLAEDQVDQALTLEARNRLYIDQSLDLGERVARHAIEQAGLVPEDIDSIISVSCTGYMIPSLDAHLLNRMKLRRNLRRTPITELGCMAGAVALSRAREELEVYPDSRILVLSVELPSLTFQPRDARPAQIISSLIFSDGAAGVVLSKAVSERPSPRILGSRTYTVPGTLGDMGYELDEDGLHIVLSPEVPNLIRETLAGEVTLLLAEHGFRDSEMKWCAMHPAGPKVLRLVEKELGLLPSQLESSWTVLSQYGNMSSAAILFVLSEMMERPPMKEGDLGIIVAFGPGVSGEILLARWES